GRPGRGDAVPAAVGHQPGPVRPGHGGAALPVGLRGPVRRGALRLCAAEGGRIQPVAGRAARGEPGAVVRGLADEPAAKAAGV
ncbi:MAG: hypothetical protein M1832_001368, partial [Thelocarpon impressellum]